METDMNDYSTMPKTCLPPNPKRLQTAAQIEAEYHFSESMDGWVPIAKMHPKWAKNALNKFLMVYGPPRDTTSLRYGYNLQMRAHTPADRISDYDRISRISIMLRMMEM